MKIGQIEKSIETLPTGSIKMEILYKKNEYNDLILHYILKTIFTG